MGDLPASMATSPVRLTGFSDGSHSWHRQGLAATIDISWEPGDGLAPTVLVFPHLSHRSSTAGMMELAGIITQLTLVLAVIPQDGLATSIEMTCFCDNLPILEMAASRDVLAGAQRGAHHLTPLLRFLIEQMDMLTTRNVRVVFRQPGRGRNARRIREMDTAARFGDPTEDTPRDLLYAAFECSDTFTEATREERAVMRRF